MMEAGVGGVIGKPITPFISSTALPIALQECHPTEKLSRALEVIDKW
jgi:AmiR/NasT family two-component response regulator